MNFDIIPADNYIWNLTDLICFLTDHQGQNIVLTTNGEGCCCQAIGLYTLLDQFEFETVTIITPNPLEMHDRYNIDIQVFESFLKVKTPIEDEFHSWNQSKIFGTVYGRPLWHRIGIVSHLSTYHYDLSLLGCLARPSEIDSRKLFEVGELFKNDPLSFQNFADNLDRFPMQIDGVDTYTPGQQNTDGYVAQTKRIYKNFLIDVVAETFTSGNCFFPTEKTIRPMLLKKPFITMGSQNYLCYLRQLGFRTFSDFWDEEYDGYEGRDRYIRILQLINDLSKKSKSELNDMYWSMKYTLDHNYDLLQNQNYNINNIEKIT
jgi:hypothetical protein